MNDKSILDYIIYSWKMEKKAFKMVASSTIENMSIDFS